MNATMEGLVHNARNRLNRISMQTELAKLLLEQGSPPEKVITALDKVLVACDECSEQILSISELKE